jgi:hypothetical protein
MSDGGDIWLSRGFSVTCILSAFIGAVVVGMLLGEPDVLILFGAVGGVMVGAVFYVVAVGVIRVCFDSAARPDLSGGPSVRLIYFGNHWRAGIRRHGMCGCERLVYLIESLRALVFLARLSWPIIHRELTVEATVI